MKRFLVVFALLCSLFFLLSGCGNQKSDLEWSAQIESGNWWDAMNYCENLNEKGKTDWYLPTIDELRTLIGKCEATEPQGFCPVSETNNKLTASDLTADCNGCDNLNGTGHSCLSFRVKGDAWFWSQSSDQKDNLSRAFGVGFERGKINLNQKYEKHYMRCVRSNHPPKKQDFQKDYVSGLKWSKISEDNMWYKDAVAYCENLREDGLSNWRVPNIDELRTLIQNCPEQETGGKTKVSEQNCCLFHTCGMETDGCKEHKDGRYSKFGDTGMFWSSSDVTGKAIKWGVSFDKAVIGFPSLFSKFRVRCVSDGNQAQKERQAKSKCLNWSTRSDEKMNYEEAKEYCKNLNENDYNDWRMPNIDELRTLVQNRKTATGGGCKVSEKNSCLYPKCWSFKTCAEACDGSWDRCEPYNFFNIYSKLEDHDIWLWSSSLVKTNMAWGINFGLGAISGTDKDSSNYIRCVRGYSEPTKIGNLYWSDKKMFLEYSEAQNYCKNLDEGGYNDWRLPNIDELRTLIKNCPKTEIGGECKISEKGNCLTKKCLKSCECELKENDNGYYSKLGLGDDNTWYWSSSSLSDDSNFALFAFFPAGAISFFNKTKLDYGHSLSFRCVRKNMPNNTVSKNEELQWSNKAPREMKFDDAKNYCQNLTENGYSDWKLPNIDELRTLIKNSPKTEPDGQCKISEKNGLLSGSDWKYSECYNIEDGNNHSKLGDEGEFWSSSFISDDMVHTVNFNSGSIASANYICSSEFVSDVRCVRDVK